jgi:hypothetical protein
MSEEPPFTEEEIAQLKEFAQNMNAYSRVSRQIRAGTIWLASGVVAGWALWENLIKHFIWRS